MSEVKGGKSVRDRPATRDLKGPAPALLAGEDWRRPDVGPLRRAFWWFSQGVQDLYCQRSVLNPPRVGSVRRRLANTEASPQRGPPADPPGVGEGRLRA
jgi:hypothetical protein